MEFRRQKNFILLSMIAFLFLILLSGCSKKTNMQSASVREKPSPSVTPLKIIPKKDPLLQAQIAHRKGKYQEAVEILEKFMEKEPDNIQIYLVLALIHRENGEPEKAMGTVEKGLARKPENLNLLEEKAQLFFLKGDLEKSADVNLKILDFYKDNTSISPDMASLAREQIAVALKKKPGSKKLKTAFRHAMIQVDWDLKMKPGDEALLKEKAYMYQKSGNYDEAVKIFRSVVEIEKKNLFVSRDIGETYLMAGNFSEAEKEYENTIKKNPKNFRSYRNYGWYWLERGKEIKDKNALSYLNKSVSYYEKALSLAVLPIDTSFLQLKAAEGKFYRWKVTKTDEDRKTAVDYFKKYYELAPEWTTTDIADHFMKELKSNEQ